MRRLPAILQGVAAECKGFCTRIGRQGDFVWRRSRRAGSLRPSCREVCPMRMLSPPAISPPFARYAHGVEVPPGARLVVTSGQLALRADGTVPDGARAQADQCFAQVGAILAEAGMGPADVIRINAYVTDRAHMAGYMAARDVWLAGADRLPASTLVIVAGFTRPEFLVEVEVTAAAP
jgi:enamine deaminase RidA (YjgF/YER057c/UK114 family)